MNYPVYRVYATTDAEGRVTQIFSDRFQAPGSGDVLIEQGIGDAYAYPQNDYDLIDSSGCHNYKIAGGQLTETTTAEKQAELAARPAPPPTETDILGQQVAALTLAGAEKDALIAQLGAQMVQAQLDIAALKGGAGA